MQSMTPASDPVTADLGRLLSLLVHPLSHWETVGLDWPPSIFPDLELSISSSVGDTHKIKGLLPLITPRTDGHLIFPIHDFFVV